MISLVKMRWVSRWLVGLFFMAQVACVVPLIGAHFQHLFASEQDAADDQAAGGAVAHSHHHHSHVAAGSAGHPQHDHGANDPNDQCCTLHHHLAGVSPDMIGAAVRVVVQGLMVVTAPDSLVGDEPALPERPPKLRPSV